MRLPRMSLMRQMQPGDSILLGHGQGITTADKEAASLACKVGGKWHTRRVQLIEDDRVIRAVILTCVESPTPTLKRGRKRGGKNKPKRTNL